MVFNKLPKEMRRTLALTLAASMVATGTQTPVLADQVQEVSVQEVQNAQTEAGEEQNVRAAEQQEEVPVAEEQTGTDKSVQKQTLSANEVNPVDPVTDPNGQESKIETQAAEEEEIEAETADGEVTSATYVEIVVQDQEGNYAGKVNCGFDFDSVNHTARLVRILPAENESDRTAVDEKSSVKLIIKTVSYNKEEYTVNTIYNDGGICGAGLPNLDLVIGKEVTLIGTNAFKDVGAKTPVKSVTFEAESGLKEIGDYAFSAANLSGEVILPQSVEILGEGAFRGTACTKFTFEAGSKMTAMGDSVFANCGKLTEVENFPSGITKIPDSSFMSDKVLAKVTYAAPEKMTGIGASAFSGCEVLVSDASYSPITENMVTIGASAFMGCKGEQFTTVTIPASVTKLEQNTFANCLSLATVTFTNTESVTEIAAKCFANDGALTECELPAKLEVLGDSAFGATALTHVRIPVTLREAKQPFSKCQQIGQIEWEEGLTKVIDNLFQNMESSLKVDFQNQITEIGNHAFDSSLITGITGTNKLVKIGEYAFNSCAGISGKVELPAVTEIHAYAFSKIFATDFEISENITLIDNSAFMNCTNLKAINKNDGVADVDLGNMTKLAEIGKQAFAGCSSIVSLRLSGTITKINDSAFSKLTTLANVKFNDNGEAGTTELGSSVFSGCTNLVEVSTAKNVGIIGSSAFSGCIKLMRLNLAEGLQIIKSGAFSGCARLEGALPEGVSEKYSSASGAKVMLPNEKAVLEIPGTVTAIEDSAFASCYSADETLQADGEKEPSDYKIGIKAVHIAGNPAGTTIGASAFAGCQNLTKLTLGEGVTGLGDSALKDTRLEEITIPSTFETGTAKNSPFTSGENSTLKKVTFADGIQVIPQYFLNNITTLTKIEIPASVQKIGDHAFADCSNLTAVTFKEQADSKLTTIDTSAFEGCSLMKLSKLPEGLTTINASAFKDCKKISLTDLPTGLITIGNAAFENCTMLRIGKLPAITALGMAAFKNCVKLSFLSVDTSNLAEINATAFEGCTGLSSVQINGGEKKQTTIADGAFATCNSLKWLDIENVKSIGKNAFAKLPFSALEINQVDTIGESAFASCDKLENPVIQNVKTIGASAFAGSGAQTDDNKVLLDSIQNVGSRAFEGCQFTSADIRDLEKVTTYTDPETKIEYSPFAKSSIKKSGV